MLDYEIFIFSFLCTPGEPKFIGLCYEPAVAVDLGVLVQVVAVLADALQLCEDALRINRERKKAVETPQLKYVMLPRLRVEN